MTFNLQKIEPYLEAMRIPLRLACTTKSGWPMALSLWYQYQNGRLYCATQKSARVVSYLRYNPRCAFEISEDHPPYCGVRGQAIARIDEETGVEILEQLLVRYLGGTDNPLARKLLANSQTEVSIILKPVNAFVWDFTNRMQNTSPPMVDLAVKVCP